MLNSYRLELDVSIAAAKKAGLMLKSCFGQARQQVDAQEAHDVKLKLDKDTQELITSLLLAAFPEDAIYGEEGQVGVSSAQRVWVIDPIDGTVNYFYGIPIFAVSIALRVDNELVLGCVYDPMQDELFTACRGQGATCND